MAELTPEANRAARAILRWSVRELAEHAGIAFTTVHRFESTGTASETTKAKIKAAYAAHDVEITNGNGTGAKLLRQGAAISAATSEQRIASDADARAQAVSTANDVMSGMDATKQEKADRRGALTDVPEQVKAARRKNKEKL